MIISYTSLNVYFITSVRGFLRNRFFFTFFPIYHPLIFSTYFMFLCRSFFAIRFTCRHAASTVVDFVNLVVVVALVFFVLVILSANPHFSILPLLSETDPIISNFISHGGPTASYAQYTGLLRSVPFLGLRILLANVLCYNAICVNTSSLVILISINCKFSFSMNVTDRYISNDQGADNSFSN